MMLLAASILSLATPALAAECRTLHDARTQWPNTYLRYATEGHKRGGRQCWSPGGTAARVIRARLPMPRPAADMTPQQRIDATYGSIIMIDIDPPGWFTIRARQPEAY